MKDLKDIISEIIKLGLAHSIAQAFLIFSGILIVVSFIWAKEYTSISFFTLFYALINFKIEALRKHKPWGNYFVGDDIKMVKKFMCISLLLFVWWIIVVIILLSIPNQRLSQQFLKDIFKWLPYWFYLVFFWLPFLFLFILIYWWFYNAFKKKVDEDQKIKKS